MTLTVLCLAAFGLVSLVASMTVGATLPLWDSVASRLPGRTQTRYWIGLALLPAMLAATAVIAALLPALGMSPDHCLAHGNHHLHLCPHHLAGTPTFVLLVLAMIAPARLTQLVASGLSNARLGFHTARSLREGSARRGDAWVFADKVPEAFVLGCRKPEIFVSEGLVALGADVHRIALAHERDHVRHRDAAFRVWFPVLATGHVPWVSRRLAQRHALAQELAADAAAACSADGPLAVADALLTIARLATRAPTTLVGIVHGDISRRVHALLHPPRATRNAPWLGTLGLALLFVSLAVLGHHEIHHGLESLLGLLHH